jgi:hypothetical protein
MADLLSSKETLIEKAGECEVVSPLRRARKPAGLSRVVAVTSDVTKSHRQAMTEHHGLHDPSFVWADAVLNYTYVVLIRNKSHCDPLIIGLGPTKDRATDR